MHVDINPPLYVPTYTYICYMSRYLNEKRRYIVAIVENINEKTQTLDSAFARKHGLPAFATFGNDIYMALAWNGTLDKHIIDDQ
jgi:hypothetical protein